MKRVRYLAIFFCVSGLIWQLPQNWLLFLPVAFVWILVAALITTVLMSIIEGWRSW